MRRFAWVLVSLCLALLTKPARAVEGQVHVGIGGGMSILQIDDKSTSSAGAGAGIDFKYGLTDAFNLHVEAQDSVVALDEKLETPTTPRTRPEGVTSAAAGLAYVFDVVRYVPYVGVLGGAAMLSGGTLPKAKVLPDVELALGLDYYLSRNWAAGVAFRQHMFVTELSTYPSFTTIFLRAEYTWW